MAFEVRFWTFTKEVNSTAIPRDDDGYPCQCKANNGIDIINPVISLRIPDPESPTFAPPISGEAPPWNYCHIHDMNRYYFVEKWRWENGLWNAYLSIDVLATYKAQIGNMRAYVLRASADWDGNIIDEMYPTKATWYKADSSNTNPWDWNFESGTYCVGIVGSGSAQYYIMSYANFTAFLRYIMSDAYADAALTTLAGVSGAALDPEAKAILDPLQYISTIKFIPVTFNYTSAQQIINVGYVGVEVMAIHCVGAFIVDKVAEQNFTAQAHPNAGSRGNYLNYPPFTERKLEFNPFGVIDIDGTLTPSGIHISTEVTIDYPTGTGILRIYSGSTTDTNRHLISLIKGQVGIDIQVGQVIAKGMGALTIAQKAANVGSQIMGGITGGGGTGMTMANMMGDVSTAAGRFGGAIGGAILSGVSGISGFIKDAIESHIPSANTIGAVGSFAEFVGLPRLWAQYAMPVDDSISTRGRPLCQQRQLSSLAATSGDNTGYILVADPDVSGIPGTAMERDMIASFLTGGFYYA